MLANLVLNALKTIWTEKAFKSHGEAVDEVGGSQRAQLPRLIRFWLA